MLLSEPATYHVQYKRVYSRNTHTQTHARVIRTFLASTNVEFKETSSLLQLPTAVGQLEGHSTTLQQSLSVSLSLHFVLSERAHCSRYSYAMLQTNLSSHLAVTTLLWSIYAALLLSLWLPVSVCLMTSVSCRGNTQLTAQSVTDSLCQFRAAFDSHSNTMTSVWVLLKCGGRGKWGYWVWDEAVLTPSNVAKKFW